MASKLHGRDQSLEVSIYPYVQNTETHLDGYPEENLIDHDNTVNLMHIDLSENAINTNNSKNHLKRLCQRHSSSAMKTDAS